MNIIVAFAAAIIRFLPVLSTNTRFELDLDKWWQASPISQNESVVAHHLIMFDAAFAHRTIIGCTAPQLRPCS